MMSTQTFDEPACEQVAGNVWQVGGAECSHPEDCGVFAVDLGDLILVDCGCGESWPRIKANMEAAGLRPGELHTLVLTHCHVDHIGAANEIQQETGCQVYCHKDDRNAIESGDPVKTASDWYRVRLSPMVVSHPVGEAAVSLEFSQGPLHLLHTPGHTPGSLVAWVDTPDAGRVLFGQDIHGPFMAQFGSDIEAWRVSMQRLLELEADVLCEGHYGTFYGADRVTRFIQDQLARF